MAASTAKIVRFVVDEKALTEQQREMLLRHSGASRKAWNWALAHHNEYQRQVQSVVRDESLIQALGNEEEAMAIRKDRAWSKAAYKSAHKAVRENQPELHHNVGLIPTGYRFRAMTKDSPSDDWAWWHGEDHGVVKVSVSFVFDDLSKAVSRYMTVPTGRSSKARKPRPDGMPDGWPRFKSKKHSTPAFAVVSGKSPVVSAHRVKVPGVGVVRVHDHTKKLQSLVSRGAIVSGKTIRVLRRGGRWNIAFIVDTSPIQEARKATRAQKKNGAVGIDPGVAVALTLSNGDSYANPKFWARDEKRMKSLQRSLARKRRPRGEESSRRYRLMKDKLSRLTAQTAKSRDGFQHRVTSEIAKKFALLGLEDTNTSSMTASAKGTMDAPGSKVKQKAGLNRSLLDVSFYGFKQKLQYKSEQSGASLILVPAAYTSQKCHACGHTARENRETQAGFKCIQCGHEDNADLNAAKNIRDTAIQLASDGARV